MAIVIGLIHDTRMMLLVRTRGPVFEHACREGHRGLEHLRSTARQAERQAK